MPPQVKIGLLIIFIILILLLLLMGGDFDNPNQNDEEFTPVYITKESDKEKIGNPDTNETVTYSIRTTYEGLASDIIVTDPIPEGVEYVSSDPKGKLFDKNGKETSNPKNVTKIVWSLRDIQYGTASESATPTGTQNNVPSVRFDADFYASEGFPTPQEPNPIELDPRALDIWKNDVAQYAVQAGEILGVDPGLIGHWSFLEGINYNISFNNCNDTGDRYNPNQPCSVNNWQLGHGVRPAETVKYLREAFEEMYGDASPETIQRVGQGVLNKMKERYPDKAITKPTSTFPRLTIDELENGMGQEDTRMWVGHLMRDDALYAYLIAKILKYHVDETQPLAEVMLGWGPDDHYAPQRVINFIKAVYDAGLSGGSNSSRKRFTDQTVKLTVKPKRDTKDTYIVNQATAEVINGGKGSSSNKSPVSGNLNNILEAAQSINDALEPGTAYEGTWYNRMITEITNNGYTATIRRGETDAYENSEQLTEAGIYWCTFTVIDSYSLAGYKGMTPENHLAVMNMIPYFKQNHIYLDYDRKNHKEILLQVKPGYAFFIMAHSDDGEHTGQEHTGMVKDIRIDANGNGYIETLESNSTAKSHKFIIENWELLPEGMAYPMRGFGGI